MRVQKTSSNTTPWWLSDSRYHQATVCVHFVCVFWIISADTPILHFDVIFLLPKQTSIVGELSVHKEIHTATEFLIWYTILSEIGDWGSARVIRLIDYEVLMPCGPRGYSHRMFWTVEPPKFTGWNLQMNTCLHYLPLPTILNERYYHITFSDGGWSLGT